MLTLKQIKKAEALHRLVGRGPSNGSCFGVTDANQLRQGKIRRRGSMKKKKK